MANYPSLYTTEVQNISSSESLGEFETLGLHSEQLVAPTRELKNFGKLHPLKKLTREGREKVKSLRPNFRGEGLLEQSPNTPVTHTTQAQTPAKALTKTPAQAQTQTPAQAQAHFDTPQPRQQSELKTKGALQRLWQALSLSEGNTNSKPPQIILEPKKYSKNKLIFQTLHKI